MSGVWLQLPFGPIRTSTVVTALVLFISVAVVRRDLLRPVVVVVAWTGFFEILYQAVGIIGFHWPLSNFVWEAGALAGWIILAGVLGFWPDWQVSLLFVALMLVWIASGYHYNVAGQSAPINARDEILNEASKTALAVAYLVGALRAKPESLPHARVYREGRDAVV